MMYSRTLLIVDDEPQNLAAMRQILADEFTLIFARAGRDAIEAAREHAPDLVLLDVQMPDMNGYAVCRTLRDDPATTHIPVIFVTSMADVGDEAAGFAAGAVDYITRPISPPIVRARVRNHLRLVQSAQLDRSYREALFMLGDAAHYKDPDTGVHIWRMAAYAAALAEARGWTTLQIEQLEMAAPLHDTGKIGMPDAILRKPGELDPEEWQIMQTHTRIGHDILARGDAPLFRLAAQIALYHHEHWDGNGYPHGLAGEQIPEAARITTIADVFDALTSKRPYKPAWSIERTMQVLNERAGSQFDPTLVALFESILPRILEIRDQCETPEFRRNYASRLRSAAEDDRPV
jgi:putative two-component system response regulator